MVGKATTRVGARGRAGGKRARALLALVVRTPPKAILLP